MANLSNINNKFLVTTGGEVLVGRTAATGTSKLQVSGSLLIGTDISSGIPLVVQETTANGFAIGFMRNTNTTNGNGLVIDVNSTGGAYIQDWRQASTVKMRLLQNGNLGIGTDLPNQLLELSKNGSPVMRLNSSKTTNGAIGDSIGRIEWRGSNNAGNGAGIKAAIDTSATSTTQRDFDILFKTGNNIGSGEPPTRMRIDADGNVGIGTDSPNNLLNLSRNVANGDVATYIQNFNADVGSTNETASVKFAHGNDGVIGYVGGKLVCGKEGDFETSIANIKGNLQFYTASGTSLDSDVNNIERMRINSSGNVGIGVTPNASYSKLQVKAPASSYGFDLIGRDAGVNGESQITFWNSNQTTQLAAIFNIADNLSFTTGTTERLRITSNGSVYNGLASNTHFGLNALSSTTTADESTAFGNFALRAQQTGRNTAVGFHTLQDLSTGNYNTAVGGEAAENITTGDSNVAVGSFALRLGTTVSASTALGYQALYNATDSSNNTAVGAQASFTLTTGTQNTSLGWNALYTASTSTKNVAVGSQSMRYHTGTDNVAVGAYSMGSGNYGNGAYNVSLGAYAGYSLNTGASNTLIGNQAGYNVLNGANNIAIGQSAMYSQESVSANIAIGRNALYANVSGGNNTAIGDQALTSCTGSNNTAVGLYAGLNTTGNSNTFMGVQTFQLTTTGGSNVGMGLQAGYNNTVGIQNTYIGYAAGYGQTGNTGNANTAIGNYSQKDRAGGSGNTSVGHYALGSDVNAGFNASDNTAVGTFAGKFVTSGALNTFVGYNAGERITSGGNNTLLGRGAGTGTSPSGQLTSESNRVCLGNNSVSHLYCKISTITTSDKRDKTNFEDIAYGLDFVNQLKPTAFEFKKDGLRDTKETDGVKRYGFLAQDILELEGENPVIINNDDKENLKYQESHLIPILVKAIQELKAEIELLKSK